MPREGDPVQAQATTIPHGLMQRCGRALSNPRGLVRHACIYTPLRASFPLRDTACGAEANGQSAFPGGTLRAHPQDSSAPTYQTGGFDSAHVDARSALRNGLAAGLHLHPQAGAQGIRRICMHSPTLPGTPLTAPQAPATAANAVGTRPGGSLPLSERLPVLDILRGFALMGILIMNMPGFSSSFFSEADGSHLWTSRLDQTAEQLRDMLFSGKFNSMFSLLFGIGFTIQYTRMQQTDPLHAKRTYMRRLLVLAALGIAHACIFWPGDVLHTYAILGIFVLFGLKRVSDRGILIGIGLCLLYPLASGLLRLAVITKEMTAQRVKIGQAFEISNQAAFGKGSFLDAAVESSRVMVHFYDNPLSLWGTLGWWVMMLLTVLIGLLAGRRRWVQRIPELMPKIRRITWWLLVIGLACGAAFTIIFGINRAPGPSPIKLLGGLCYGISRLALMLFYVMVIVQLSQRVGWRRFFAPLAAAGRMPLTNYLMQTFICTAIFNGWGLGLYGQVGPAAGLVLSLAIFWAVQVPWSLWWLKSHERGPLEALWAWSTYGRRPAATVAGNGH
jgi:uncharacterized protein